MITSDYCSQILHRLNEWLADRDLHLTEDNVLFVRDDAVDYSAVPYCVDTQDLVNAERCEDVFGTMFAGGPSWIHANVIPFSNDRFLITLIAGQKTGSPQPSINVSYEQGKLAEIALTKTLLAAN